MIIKNTREDIYRECFIKVRIDSDAVVHHEIIAEGGGIISKGKGRGADPNNVFDLLKVKVDSRVDDASRDWDTWNKMQTGEIEI